MYGINMFILISYFSPEFGSEEELRAIFSWEASVEQYTSLGGTSRSAVNNQIEILRIWLQQYDEENECFMKY